MVNGKALTLPTPKEGTLVTEESARMTREQIDLMKRTICPELDDNETQLFVHFSNKHRADPLSKEAWVQKRWSKKKDRDGNVMMRDGKPVYEARLVMGLSRHQVQKRLEERADFAGIEAGIIHEKDDFTADLGSGTVKHVIKSIMLNQRGMMVAAWCRITRTGKTPYVHILYMSERKQEYYGKAQGGWASMEGTMLEKCCIMDTVRVCYPKEFGDVADESEADAFGEKIDPAKMQEVSAPQDEPETIKEIQAKFIDAEPEPAPVPAAPPFDINVPALGSAFITADQLNGLKAAMQEFKLTPDQLAAVIKKGIGRDPKSIADVRKPEYAKIVKLFEGVRMGAYQMLGGKILTPDDVEDLNKKAMDENLPF